MDRARLLVSPAVARMACFPVSGFGLEVHGSGKIAGRLHVNIPGACAPGGTCPTPPVLSADAGFVVPGDADRVPEGRGSPAGRGATRRAGHRHLRRPAAARALPLRGPQPLPHRAGSLA